MDRQRTHDWETHGKSNDIDESTPINKVKGPNVFERAKEEIEALVEALHPKGSPQHEHHERNYAENEVESSNLLERAKKGTDEPVHRGKTHHKETHGMSNDIDENTPIGEVVGPNLFERAKEEIEALVEAIHPKKESDNKPQ
ncbi:unnamed protein product [Musa acuminata subsp. malaccensis]|uniref:(wild Malaysian banana) hypothetical protein n=1 Tax=Musa acuminata subsp. malaccensis TaxID=214687 RepID=A0A8D6ZNY3_MUSAM|nr:unnamed protein product [Musa acuminata subsp. malaccensis]